MNMTMEAVSSNANVYTLGPLIHNGGALEGLKKQGVKILEEHEIDTLPEGSTVVIRAHGVAPKIERLLYGKDIRILDATCPHVKESQKKARHFAESGYRVFLAGEENHGEIIGIRGYVEAASSISIVVANTNEAESAALKLFHQDRASKTALIGQTTISTEEYKAIGESIKLYFPNLEIIDTICAATVERQEALRELCGQVEAVIIAGGRESANTRRLLSLARELGKPSWLVEKPDDIPDEVKAYKRIGLSAGASTPDDLVMKIEETLKR